MKSKTLVVKKQGKIIFSSSENGLKPLIECIAMHLNEMEGSNVWDKVVGLAAAKLFVYAKVNSVNTKLISHPAQELLKNCGIKFTSDKFVPAILNADGKLCKMEAISLEFDGEELFSKIRKKLLI